MDNPYVKVFKNAISNNEREILLVAHQALQEQVTTYPKRTISHLETNEKEIIKDILNRNMPPHTTSEPVITTLWHPALIHSDYTGNFEIVTLLLLEIDPIDAKSFTILFDQLETKDHFIIYSKTNLEGRAPRMNDYSHLINVKKQPEIPAEFHQQYLEFLDEKDLEGFSLRTTVEWEVGDIIAFDSRIIHCSASFTNFNLQSKTWVWQKISFL